MLPEIVKRRAWWRQRRWRYLGFWAAVVVLVILLALAIWAALLVLPSALVDRQLRPDVTHTDRLKEIDAVRTSLLGPLATLIGAGAVLAGAAVAYFNFRGTLELNRRGQVTDRFTKSIDQLGHGGDENLDLRLGAIYALEQIAKDSPELHGPIMNILCAFLRIHAQAPLASRIPPEDPSLPTGLKAMLREGRLRARRAEVQAVVTVLSHRKNEHDGTCRIDLQGVDLEQSDFRKAPLREANLVQANLKEASLVSADLCGADLRNALLAGANLEDARLAAAHVEGVDLSAVTGLIQLQLDSAFTSGAKPPNHLRVRSLEESTPA